MGDSELDAIRARRMAEMQQQQGGGEGAQKQMQQRAQQQDMKNMMLSQVLDQAARSRLNTIAVAKPEKAQMVESLICQMAQRGQLQGQKLSEQALIGLLEQVSSSTQKTSSVKFDRRRVNLDSDDDWKSGSRWRVGACHMWLLDCVMLFTLIWILLCIILYNHAVDKDGKKNVQVCLTSLILLGFFLQLIAFILAQLLSRILHIIKQLMP